MEKKEELWKSVNGSCQNNIIKANDKVKAADDPEKMLQELS